MQPLPLPDVASTSGRQLQGALPCLPRPWMRSRWAYPGAALVLASAGQPGRGGAPRNVARNAHAAFGDRGSSDSDGGERRRALGGGAQQRKQEQQQEQAAAAAAAAGGQPAAAGAGSSGSSGGGLNKLLISAGMIGGLLALGGTGMLMKDQIRGFLDYFIDLVENFGPLGYLAYAAVYTALEVLAVPAIPLTMTAGAIFGVIPGTMVVSVAGTMACTISFLIARYVARDKVKHFEKSHPRFAAIDRAIGRDSFKVVTLLRLSPLLPLAASNYLYGLTSVELGPYVLGSWLGMLPGTFAYVSAGTYGKALLGLEGAEGGAGVPMWQVGLGLGLTAFAVWYVGRLATRAIAAVDAGLTYDESDGPPALH